MTAASEWVAGLNEAIEAFSGSRGSPVVRVHLNTERFNVQRATAGPGERFVTFDVYPDVAPGGAVLDAMVKDAQGEYHTPRVVIVSLAEVRKIELLHESPGRSTAFGFRAPDA